MTGIDYTYYKDVTQLWLIKVVLLFSVFLFSGFNENIQSRHLESTKIELVESKDSKTILWQENFETSLKIVSTGFTSNVVSSLFYSSKLSLNFEQSIILKYKVVSKKFLLQYSSSSIQSPIKTIPSSSKDENPSFLIG